MLVDDVVAVRCEGGQQASVEAAGHRNYVASIWVASI